MATETHTFTLPAPVRPIEHDGSLTFKWTAQLRAYTVERPRNDYRVALMLEMDVEYTVNFWGTGKYQCLDFELESVNTEDGSIDGGTITAITDHYWFRLFAEDAARNHARICEKISDHIAQSDRHERSRDND